MAQLRSKAGRIRYDTHLDSRSRSQKRREGKRHPLGCTCTAEKHRSLFYFWDLISQFQQ